MKLNIEDENPLWRYYMDNVDMMDNKWLKEFEIKTPHPQKTHSVYSEDEFLEKIENDKDFYEMWGNLKTNNLYQSQIYPVQD